MARADWRSAGAYEDLQPLDAPAYAYEFLRRNADFLADHARLTRQTQTQALDDAETEEFARRWGVRFRDARSWWRRSPPSVDSGEPAERDPHNAAPTRSHGPEPQT